jgi:hypothetical protein
MMSTTNAHVQRKPGSVWADLSELIPYAFGTGMRSLVDSQVVPLEDDDVDFAAYYDEGILTVSVELSQPKLTEKRIPVQSVS